jgi:peptide/nickel transport system substrate-binding protein
MKEVSRLVYRREWLKVAAATPFAIPAFGDSDDGVLRVSARAEPRSFQPLAALDEPTRLVASLCHACLVRTNGVTHQAEPQLAERFAVSPDGRRIDVQLRSGLRFSDGSSLTADDVLFTFQAHLDPATGSPQRDSLVIGGEPMRVIKRSATALEFTIAEPFALGARLLDSVAILPRQRLEKWVEQGKISESWGLDAPPSEVVGAGPFRLASYRAGIGLRLERNPHYFRSGYPKLPALELVPSAGEDAQVARVTAGEADLVTGFSAGNHAVLEKYRERRGLRIYDLGPSLDYSFVLFNLGRPDAAPPLDIRRCMARAIDRAAIARLVFRGFAAPLTTHVTPGRGAWRNQALEGVFAGAPSATPSRRYTLLVNSGNPAQTQMASIIEADLAKAKVPVSVVPLEFRSLVDRIVNRRDFEMAIMSLRAGDLDPVADMNVLLSSGQTHLWNPRQSSPATPWEAEIDRLMKQQAATMDFPTRKKAFDRVQAILADQVPWIPLVSPHTLLAARKDLAGLRPSLVGNPALWNAEELYWQRPA